MKWQSDLPCWRRERKITWRPKRNIIQCIVKFTIIPKSSTLEMAGNSSSDPFQLTCNMTTCLIKDLQDEILGNMSLVLSESLVPPNVSSRGTNWNTFVYCSQDCITFSTVSPQGPFSSNCGAFVHITQSLSAREVCPGVIELYRGTTKDFFHYHFLTINCWLISSNEKSIFFRPIGNKPQKYLIRYNIRWRQAAYPI